LDDGSEAVADACIAAVPHVALLKMLPANLAQQGGVLAGLRQLETSPITGVHLWFDRVVMEEPFLALLDHTTQWIFNKTKLYATDETESTDRRLSGASNEIPAEKGQYLQLVISASYDLVEKTRQEIIDLCLRELADVLPETRVAQLRKATVIKEVNATFSPRPGADHWRPAQNIGYENFFLAGDWTQTGWPSTMEGAVRSGYLAAEALITVTGGESKLVQPDLPLEGLCRVWAKSKN
jgi:zeta-carotene desaturase